ncbi:MAG: SprT family zinc-dependent metalloprotease [Gammaproteobacteria bacterium]|nr:SprT family zinc-dependent metalloprotease [Gammaproteobacteria bacterium]
MIIELDGIPVTLLRKRVKNINLRIQPTGDVRISAPIKMSLDVVHRFLQDKRVWIDSHRSRLQAQPQDSPQTLQTGDSLLFLGQRYDVLIHETATKNHLTFEHQKFNFFVKPDVTLKQKQALLTAWYHAQMQQRLPTLFEKWETVIGVHALSYRIRTMKTRWGSCHPIKKDICLNLRLMQKPPICLEYIMVHELVHLLEASHNRRFHAFMTQFMPDWKIVKRLL